MGWPDKGIYSIVFRTLVNYGCKMFYNIGPLSQCHNPIFPSWMLLTNKLARLTLSRFFVLVDYFRSLTIIWRSVRFFTWVDYCSFNLKCWSWLKRLTRRKHSSLFVRDISDEENKVFTALCPFVFNPIPKYVSLGSIDFNRMLDTLTKISSPVSSPIAAPIKNFTVVIYNGEL
jgi:hypothetical protein